MMSYPQSLVHKEGVRLMFHRHIMYVCKHAYIHTCMYAFMCTSSLVCTYVCICVFVCLCAVCFNEFTHEKNKDFVCNTLIKFR